MKTKNLLPHAWRLYGCVLLLICLPLSLWYLLGGENDFLHTKIAPLLEVSFEDKSSLPFLIERGNSGDSGWTENFLDEILSIGVIVGLIIVGFSKLKVEDEYIAVIRLEALQWGVYANYMVLVCCIIFVYFTDFLSVMMYNMFTPLLIFVLRFYWLLWKRRDAWRADL